MSTLPQVPSRAMKYLCLWCFIVLVLLTTIEGLVVKVAPRNQTVGLRTRSPTLEISKYTAWTGGASFNVDFRIRVDELDLQAQGTKAASNSANPISSRLHFAICGEDTLEKISMSDADWWSTFNGGASAGSTPNWESLDDDISLSVCNHMEHIRTCAVFESLTGTTETISVPYIDKDGNNATRAMWDQHHTFEIPHLPGETVYYIMLLNCRQLPIYIMSLSGTFMNHAASVGASGDGDVFPDTSAGAQDSTASNSGTFAWLSPLPTHLSAGEIPIPKAYFVFSIGWALVTIFVTLNWLRYQHLPKGILKALRAVSSACASVCCRSSCCRKTKSSSLGPLRRRRNRAYIIKLCSKLGKASRTFLRRSRRGLEGRSSKPRYRIWIYTALLLLSIVAMLQQFVLLTVWIRVAWYGAISPLTQGDPESGRPGWLYPVAFDVLSSLMECFRMVVLISLSKGISVVRATLTRPEKINMLLLSTLYGVLYYMEQVSMRAAAVHPTGVVYLGQRPIEQQLLQRILGPLSVFWSAIVFKYPVQIFSIVIFKYILANINYILPCLTTQLALVRRHDHTIDLEHTNVWKKIALLRLFQTAVVCYIFGLALALVASVFLTYEKPWANISAYQGLHLLLFAALCYGFRLRDFSSRSSSFISRLYSGDRARLSRRNRRHQAHSLDDRVEGSGENTGNDTDRDDAELIVNDEDEELSTSFEMKEMSSKPPSRSRRANSGDSLEPRDSDGFEGHSSGDDEGEKPVENDDDVPEFSPGGPWGVRRRQNAPRNMPHVLVVLNPPTLSHDKTKVVPSLAMAATSESTFFEAQQDSSDSDDD